MYVDHRTVSSFLLEEISKVLTLAEVHYLAFGEGNVQSTHKAQRRGPRDRARYLLYAQIIR